MLVYDRIPMKAELMEGKPKIPKEVGTQTNCFSTPVVIVVTEWPFTCLHLIMAIIITLAQILEGTQFTAVNVQQIYKWDYDTLDLWRLLFFQFQHTFWHETLIWIWILTFVLVITFYISFIRRSMVVRFLPCHVEESRAGMDAKPVLFFSLHHVPWICQSGMWLNSLFGL